MSSLEVTVRSLFDGYACAAPNLATLPLVDFEPPVTASQLEVLCSAMNAAVQNWEGITALVGLAERSSGPLTHLLAHRRQLPYSLVNWYPEGSKGDIVVGPALSFTGEQGNTFLNGLRPKERVLYVDDCLRNGWNARNVIRAARNAGVDVVGAVFVAKFTGCDGDEQIKTEFGIDVISLCEVDATGSATKVVSVASGLRLYAPAVLPAVSTIKKWTADEVRPKFEVALAAFVGNEIYRATGSDYPYCNFQLTDCQPLLQPEFVEALAECMIYLGDFARCELIISEADRGGGPLAVAIARRTGLPFTLANWKPPANAAVGVTAAANVGYSGQGSLYLNGIRRGQKCVVIDDMLSSGGTAEGLFRAIETAGGVLVEAHFASEKVTTKGRERLGRSWPSLPLLSVCFFDAVNTHTTAVPPGPGANETPLQRHAGADDGKVAPAPSTSKRWMQGFIRSGNMHRVICAAMVLFYCATQ